MAQAQFGVGHRAFAQLLDRLADARHGLDHIGPGLALGGHGERRLAVVADVGNRVLIGKADVGDIGQGDPRETAGFNILIAAQNHGAHLLDAVEFGYGAHHVAPLALLDIAGGHREIRSPQGGDHVGHGEAEAGHALGLNGDTQLAFGAAVDIDPGDAGHPLKPVLQDVSGKVAVGVHGAAVVLDAA